MSSNNKMKGLLKGLRYISEIFENEKEPEMEIGMPTDVKHVAHIGVDGPAAAAKSAPSWMNEFKSGNNGDVREEDAVKASDMQQDVPKSTRKSDKSKQTKKGSKSSASKESSKKKAKDPNQEEAKKSSRQKKSKDCVDGSSRRDFDNGSECGSLASGFEGEP